MTGIHYENYLIVVVTIRLSQQNSNESTHILFYDLLANEWFYNKSLSIMLNSPENTNSVKHSLWIDQNRNGSNLHIVGEFHATFNVKIVIQEYVDVIIRSWSQSLWCYWMIRIVKRYVC